MMDAGSQADLHRRICCARRFSPRLEARLVAKLAEDRLSLVEKTYVGWLPLQQVYCLGALVAEWKTDSGRIRPIESV